MIPLETLTLWQGESLASHLATQDSDEAQRMTATSGRMLLPLLKDDSPLGCLSRMFLASSAWRSTSYKLTWKAQATKRKRMYFRLAPLVRRTSENVSSSWPTPLAGDADHGGPNARDSKGRSSLTGAVHHAWPTPSATNAEYSSTGYGPTLNQMASWPTPVAIDAGSGRINRSASPNATERPTLAMMAHKGVWPTPTANDSKNATLPPGAAQRDSLPGALIRMWPTPTANEDHYRLQGETQQSTSLNAIHKGNLNPEWVEALMGFPLGWTAIDGLLPQAHKRNGNRRVRSRTRSRTERRDSKH